MAYSFDPDMSKRFDDWLTTPPESEESVFKCDHCKEPFFPNDEYYTIEGENLCYECAFEWLKSMCHTADEDQCYEED